MLVYTANVAQTVRHAGRFGIRAGWKGADWPAIRDRVFGRIDPLHDRAVVHRRAGGIDAFLGEARFTGPKVLWVGGEEIRADRFVLAAGSRPAIPPVPGLADVPYLTSDTVMRLGRLPKSMVVLGGGYIAAEMSHIFGSLGTKVTIVTRGEHLPPPGLALGRLPGPVVLPSRGMPFSFAQPGPCSHLPKKQTPWPAVWAPECQQADKCERRALAARAPAQLPGGYGGLRGARAARPG